MQNRYVGDIGDFGKLGLLRELAKTGLSIGVNWYLVPDENHNGDGRHTDYLKDDYKKKSDFIACDEELWRCLGEIVHKENRREVAALENAALFPAVYWSKKLDLSGKMKPERDDRETWHRDALEKLKSCRIVFVDPDNGLMVPSAYDTAKACKYVLPRELAEYYAQGASVIYYQHKARRDDDWYRDRHRELLCSGFFPGASGLGLKFTRTSQRYYFFLLQPEHKRAVLSCADRMLKSPWGKLFEEVD